jgi:DNA-directed RNA polymerase specialized sigma24 family protein
VIQNEQSQNIWALARTLSKNQYEALWLCYVEDIPAKDIAKIMKKTQISVRVLLHRARLNLAKRLDQSASLERLARTTNAEQNFNFNE